MKKITVIRVETNDERSGWLEFLNGNIELHRDVGDFTGEPPMIEAGENIPDPVFEGEYLSTEELWKLLLNQANNDSIPWLNISNIQILNNGDWL